LAGSTNFPSSLDSHTGASPLGFGEVNNQAYTKTTASHTNSVTTITVASTALFPSKGFIVVKREIISYTGTTATTFTGCTRGVGGTTAAAFLSGTLVEQVVVAANHNDLAAAIVAVETVLGPGITASYGVVRKIAEVSGTGASGVLEFSSIPSSYRSLRVIWMGKSDAATPPGLRLTFETSPTAGAYNNQTLQVSASTTTVSENLGTSDFIQAGVVSSNVTANIVASGDILLPEYANTSVFKTALCLNSGADVLSTGNFFFRNVAGLWESTAAINRIRLTLSSGSWTTTSRATLYGVPA